METEGPLPCSQDTAKGPIPSQINPVHIPPPYFIKINLILASIYAYVF